MSWARYLKLFGYYPVILTRRWDHKVNTLADVSRSTPSDVLHEVYDGYEVYSVPYHANLRDSIYVKHGEHKYALVRRLLTLLELLLQNFFPSVIPYYNLFEKAEELVAKDKEIKKVVITGNPFNLFYIGYRLNKKFGLQWIADYRDAWTTSEINQINRSAIFKLITAIDTYFEKKWVGTASYITASSGPIADSITQLTGVKSSPLYNGFVQEDFDGVPSGKFDDFTVTYVGTLYHGQKVEIFCDAYRQLIDATPGIKAKLYFPGLAFYKEQTARIEAVMKGYEAYYECTPRIERSRILEIERRSHLLMHVAWDEQKGIIASKIYEYIASGTYIVVTPNDHGSIQEIVEASGCGICTSTVAETFTFLQQEYEQYLQGHIKVNDVNKPAVQQFSRQQQVKHLADLLNSI